MLQPKLLAVAILASSLGLVACNDNNDAGASPKTTSTVTTTTITVTPSLGKIVNARVILRNVNGQDLAPAKTLTPADNGVAKFTVPISALAQPVVAAVLPTLAGKVDYIDEALNNQISTITVPVADANKPILRSAAVVTQNANLAVTALTEAAVKQAEQATGGLISQNINAANNAVKDQLKLNFNISEAPEVIGQNELAKLINSALDQQRRAYAAYLATLAQQAKRMNSTSTTPAFDMAKALAQDFSDGTFDAKVNQVALDFYSTNFLTAWVNWVTTVYSQLLNFATAAQFNYWFDRVNVEQPTDNTPAVPIRVEDGVEEYACNEAAKLKSGTNNNQLNISFVNQTGSPMNVDWINFTGALQNYSRNLANGQTYTIQPTFLTHPWKVTNNQGQCLGVFVAKTATAKTLTFKANEVIIGTPVVAPNCSNKGLPFAAFSVLKEFAGSYAVDLNGSAKTLSLSANDTSAQITLNGQSKNLTEICGSAQPLTNGTSYLGLFNGGEINFFKTNTNPVEYSTEGLDFTGSSGVYFGKKQSTTTLCNSEGTDDKLGFINAPADFCSFTRQSSIAITSPDIYTFVNADANIKITLTNNAITSVELENNKYSFACGIGNGTGNCGGSTAISSANFKQFTFTNVVLTAQNGTTQNLTIRNGALIHPVTTAPTSPIQLSACTVATNSVGTNCGAGVLADFSYSWRNAANNKACAITKNGATVRAESDGKIAIAEFDNGAGDTAQVSSNAAQAFAQNADASHGIQIIFNATGQAVMITSVVNKVSFICVPI
ncbi:hypothetical protein [Agitococcus lubricus]|uniref:von Hippel-Lindau disease tumor suppressor protein n=1 Tax=Agitococcus lubricus TaxID=1077255 RepID=A0A2T5IWR8_9GAMM|nr:hypothetical protein [Agitococcus lubricus]PTQ88368.1 von Hippel-Lindau disease tumor suppressor protein [Agitococcus lubricus]